MGLIEEVEDDVVEDFERCPVCNKRADLNCTACKAVTYCGKGCQKTHWKKHKVECKKLPYKVESTEELGKYLTARRDLAAGEVLFTESPLVVGPIAITPPVCLNCYNMVDGSFRCRKSGWPLCGPICEEKVKHNPEIVIPAQTQGYFEVDNFGEPNYLYECIAPLRALMLQKTAPKKFQKIMSLVSHFDRRKGTEAWTNTKEKIIDVAKKTLGVMVFEALCPQLDLSDDLIQRINGIFDTNAIEIRLQGSEIMALYETACLLEHSCGPNLRMTFGEDYSITVRAGRDIKAGEHLSIMYTHSLWGTWARRDHLFNSKMFWCQCERCADPTEFGTNFSTVMKDGKTLLPVNPLNQDAGWSSADGSVTLTPEEYQDDMSKIGAELAILQIKGTVEEYDEFLEKYAKVLHANHYHMLTAKHSLMQMLGRTEGHVIQDMTMDELKRKEHLCRELIELIGKIDPCQVRLQIYAGVAMFELHLPLLQYGKRDWESGELATEDFRKTLMEPRDWLVRALEMLKDETSERLPEGQLRLQVQGTLEQLELFMKTVGCEF